MVTVFIQIRISLNSNHNVADFKSFITVFYMVTSADIIYKPNIIYKTNFCSVT